MRTYEAGGGGDSVVTIRISEKRKKRRFIQHRNLCSAIFIDVHCAYSTHLFGDDCSLAYEKKLKIQQKKFNTRFGCM